MIFGYFILGVFLICMAAVLMTAIMRIPEFLGMAYEMFLRWFRPASYQTLLNKEKERIENLSRERDERLRLALEKEAEAKRKMIQDAADAEKRRKEFLEWLDYSDVKGPWGPQSSREELSLRSKPIARPVDYRSKSDRSKKGSWNKTSSSYGSSYGSYGSPRHSFLDSPPQRVHAPLEVRSEVQRRANHSAIVEKFEEAGIHLYHFTPAENVESINQQDGLLPRSELVQKEYPVHHLSSLGSRETDDRKGLSNYVHLAFHDVHSMLSAVLFRRAGEVIVYQVSLLVLDFEGCCFTRALANANVAVLTPIDEMDESDLAAIALGGEAKKWQLLVPGRIPKSYLREYCRHQGLDNQWRPGLYS